MTGPISLSSRTRNKLFVEILKLVSHNSIDDEPSFQLVGNWSQGISYEYEGILLSDKNLLLNEKPSINKTLIITTIEVPFQNPFHFKICIPANLHLSSFIFFYI